MGEQVGSIGAYGYNERPSHEAKFPIDDQEQEKFSKDVEYWSGASDVTEAARAADTAEASMAEYMRKIARHRDGTNLERTRTRTGMKYERGGVSVTCVSTDDLKDLLVEERRPHATDADLEEVTRTQYVIDGPDKEVVQDKWLVDVETGERVGEDLSGLDDLLTFGSQEADITLPVGRNDDLAFTKDRFWEAQEVIAALAEEGWQRTPA